MVRNYRKLCHPLRFQNVIKHVASAQMSFLLAAFSMQSSSDLRRIVTCKYWSGLNMKLNKVDIAGLEFELITWDWGR